MTPPPTRTATPDKRHRVVSTLYLVRHAKAINRERWGDADEKRPLTRRGVEQASTIAADLLGPSSRRPSRVLSSPALRCQQTVGPLAEWAQLEIVDMDWLAEGSNPAGAFEKLRRLTVRLDPPSGRGGPVVACTHGDVMWGVLDELDERGVDLGPRADAPKGSAWILGMTSTKVRSVTFYMPDLARKVQV